MKLIVFLQVFLMPIFLKSQVKEGKILIKVISYKDTISKRADGIIKAVLNNESPFPIIIPYAPNNGSLNALPKNFGKDIFYDIIFCSDKRNDTLVNGDHIIATDIDYNPPSHFIVLESLKTQNIRCSLDYWLFKRIGKYKIRFGFKASKLNRCYKDVYSEWFTIVIANPNYTQVE